MPGRPLPALSPADMDRFWSQVEVADNGCWWWTGNCSNQGYGQFTLHLGYDRGRKLRRRLRSHRVAWQLWHDLLIISDLDHTCHNADASCPGGDGCLHRRCVRPAHLQPTLPGDNSRRGRARIKHCRCGREYDMRWPTGVRDCRVCWQARYTRGYRAWRERQPPKPPRVPKPKPLPARLIRQAWRENELWDEAHDPSVVVYVVEA